MNSIKEYGPIHLDYLEGNGRGIYRAPDLEAPYPAVLALGGSDGGTPQYFADLLVPEGFACLALAYWGTPDTQAWFTEIPLERIERALHWLIDRLETNTHDGRAALVGASRGAELALLVAATFPELVGPVVAYTPSSVVWQGFDPTLPPGGTRSSWTFQGKPLAHVSFAPGTEPVLSGEGTSWLPVMEAALNDAEVVDRAMIAVERCTGPVLLVSGGDDNVWPAAKMCGMLTDKMAKRERRDGISHLHYPKEATCYSPIRVQRTRLLPRCTQTSAEILMPTARRIPTRGPKCWSICVHTDDTISDRSAASAPDGPRDGGHYAG